MEGLGISLSTLVAQLINFVILLGLLYLLAYKPVMRMLDERSRRVKESMDQTEQVKEQAAAAEQETAKKIGEASEEAAVFHGYARMCDRWLRHGTVLG